ncbi:hypothetical protein BDQ17DRAFT_1241729 [Cyathus striatus]|nr:hypothetical protein BDQ17DRAFT_1241729 [Cyathus striatus]
MMVKTSIGFIALSLLAATKQALGREQWLERDGRAVYLYPRRFGQEQPAVLQKLQQACPGQVCGNLAGQAVTPLLAAQPECSQQDMADAIIDASKQFDAATQANMIAIAVEYRQAEKNTPPDFSANPPSLRNSVFCQKAPKNSQLNGLVQAQDPSNDPNLFFDPAKGATVKKGTQANTFPFGTNGAACTAAATETANSGIPEATKTGSAILTVVTVTVSATNPAATDPTAATITVGDSSAATTSTAVPAATPPAGADFGSCTTPEIEFGVGFDNRKETSFEPTDKKSYNHGSAQNIGIITKFICDTLTNSCGANQAAKDICQTALTAATAAAAGTGAQADAFNAAFGITTQFVNVASVDNQGKIVPGTGASAGNSTSAVATAAAETAATSASAAASATALPSSNKIGNFGSCSVPQIEFGVGFDNRKETSFQPVNKTSFNHGSAQNIDIITQAICDQLTNSCGADATAKATCATATAAASAAAKGTGAQADAFNAAFGITTNFASVAPVDNQGNTIVAGASQTAVAAPTTPLAPVANTAAVTTTSSATSETTAASTGASAGNLQTFTGSLGGVTAPTVTGSGDTFQVEGNSSFKTLQSALARSCDVQNNKCADAANASGNKDGLTVAACSTQQAQCAQQAGSSA